MCYMALKFIAEKENESLKNHYKAMETLWYIDRGHKDIEECRDDVMDMLEEEMAIIGSEIAIVYRDNNKEKLQQKMNILKMLWGECL